MLYRYETHLHTSEASACADSTAAELVRAYVDAGYAGVIVTDHFISENRNAPDSWPWERKLRYMYSGYEAAAEAGSKLGLDVFFGWEMPMDNAEDYLTYNLPLDFLLDNPQIGLLSLPEYSRLVRGAGGLIVRAHPFRQTHYTPPVPTVRAKWIDGVEVNNGYRDDPEQNNPKAQAFAREHPELFRTSGGDVHLAQNAGIAGMAFERRFETMAELAEAMRKNEGTLIVDGRMGD